jgi:predicted acyltransferase
MIASDIPDNPWWNVLQDQTEHVAWRGCSSWDLIQPSFMFIVGAAMPFSYANRRQKGQPWGRLFGHAVWRSFILIALGLFLTSAWSPRTNFTFTNVLVQIGLGYAFVFLLLGRPLWLQASVALAILAGDWLLFATYPTPAPETSHQMLGLHPSWIRMTGWAAHWEKHTNAAAHFDRWFLNLFPRPDGKPFQSNEGGYTTLNFVPSLATMIFGVMAGQWLQSQRSSRAKFQTLLIVGALCLAAGTLMDTTVCPIVKRIWTPSWVVYSTGWTCWLLALFYGVIDVLGYRRWAFPLVVVGVNSIAMYVMAQLLKPFVAKQLKVHLGPEAFNVVVDGVSYAPVLEATAITAVLWLVCLWLYRQKIFLKI